MAGVIGIASDVSSRMKGEITSERLAYRGASFAMSFALAGAVGGPAGMLLGAGVGVLAMGGEYIYDTYYLNK